MFFMFLPKVEENKSIDQINHLLKEFEKQLNILPLETVMLLLFF